jgi:membrane protein YqaA with SNARE-associated domain
MTLTLASLLTLFSSAFLAATLLPAQSEAVLVGLLLAQPEDAAVLIATASLGNTLGAMVNWGIGLGIQRFRSKRWFPVSVAQLERAERHYRRFGRWSLLLSWMPVIGDPLVLVAGVLKEKFWVVLLLTAIAKTGRYLVLAAATLAWSGFE